MKIDKKIVICFDTNIFDSTQYNFDENFYTLFKDMKSERYPNLEIFIDPIIYNEVISHLKKKAKESKQKLDAFKNNLLNLEMFTDLNTALDIKDFEEKMVEESENKFREFIEFFTNELNTDFNYDVNEILNDYFNLLPPFEDKKNKKNEFPDALILQNLKNKFSDCDNFIMVSSDKGFISAVNQKMPQIKTYINYNDCLNDLNKQHEEYNLTYKKAQLLLDDIKREFLNKISNLSFDFVETYYAEELGVKIEVTNYDRQGVTELYELDEIMFHHIDMDNPRIRILSLSSGESASEVEVDFDTEITMLGKQDESDDLIEEIHKLRCSINAKMNTSKDRIEETSLSPILLDKRSLVNRTIERDYFAYQNYEYDYAPSLHPTNDTYTITCESCGIVNKYFSPEMSEFSVSSSERNMGPDTLYELQVDEICANCTKPLILDIQISEYPYGIIDLEEVRCSGGEASLSFEIS